MNTLSKIKSHKIIPDPLKDQFFLMDKSIIENTVSLADIKPGDVILEIGAGIGNLTEQLAKTGARIIAFEIDIQFESVLLSLPENVEVHIEDVHEYASGGGKHLKRKEYNKVIANIPYSIAEWLLHNLAYVEYDKVILLVSKKFANTAKNHHIFTSFYEIEEKMKVPKDKFFPVPKTNSIVIDLIRLPDPVKTKNLPLFLRQFIYQKEDWKVKNSLREGLIEYARLVYKKQLTKRRAKKIIEESKISKDYLERPPDSLDIYLEIGKTFDKLSLKSKINTNVN